MMAALLALMCWLHLGWRNCDRIGWQEQAWVAMLERRLEAEVDIAPGFGRSVGGGALVNLSF